MIGVKFANRFNFVLAYNENNNNRIENNLYLQPRNNFQRFESTPYCSKLGFDIEISESGFIVKRIEIGGLADKAGLKVKDKVLDINGEVCLDKVPFDEDDLNKCIADKGQVVIKVDREGKIKVFLIETEYSSSFH